MDHLFNIQGHVMAELLALLGTCFALGSGLVTMIYLLVAQKLQFCRVLLLFMVAGVGLYLATLFAFSMAL